MRILVIEDNEKLAQSIKKGLGQQKIIADYVTDGNEGYQRLLVAHRSYDAVVLDLMLPGKDGISVCHDLRKQNIPIPILMLTAKDTITDKLTGFAQGADDYLVKPFAFDELLARIAAITRRPQAIAEQEISVGPITLNVTTRTVSKNKKRISLSQKEFTILEYLMRNPGRVVTRQEILDHAWEYEFNSFSNLVDVKIKNIRKKIDPDAATIETIRGVGYRFNRP